MGVLTDKVVVVVGAGSSGAGWSNGSASAVSYARAGASVVCADFVLERAEQTAALIAGEGGAARAVQVDAGDEDSVRALMTFALEDAGHLDVVHNNVGIGGTSGLPDQIPLAAWEREIRQNLTTAYLGIRCAVPHFRAQGGGVVTNTSSLLAVRFLRRPNSAYTASKAGVEALTRACAAGYGRDNIRVNCLRIGFSESALITSAMATLPPDRAEVEMAKSRAKVPLRGEHTDPLDVGAAAVFLASDAAKHMTGVILNVDGGLECAPI